MIVFDGSNSAILRQSSFRLIQIETFDRQFTIDYLDYYRTMLAVNDLTLSLSRIQVQVIGKALSLNENRSQRRLIKSKYVMLLSVQVNQSRT